MKKIETRSNGSLRVATLNNEESRTQQQFKEQCDVNHIMRKYATTGTLTHLNHRRGVYGDFSEIKDYRASLHAIMSSNDAFLALPSALRKKFNNDPAEFLDFVSNPANREEARNLGLLKPDAPQTQLPETKRDEPNDAKKNPAKKVQPKQMELPDTE